DPAKRDGGRRTAAARRDRTGMGRNLGRALWTGARRTAAGTAGNRRVVAHALSGKSQASTDARSSRDTQRPGPESGGLSRAVREPARPGRRVPRAGLCSSASARKTGRSPAIVAARRFRRKKRAWYRPLRAPALVSLCAHAWSTKQNFPGPSQLAPRSCRTERAIGRLPASGVILFRPVRPRPRAARRPDGPAPRRPAPSAAPSVADRTRCAPGACPRKRPAHIARLTLLLQPSSLP